MVEGSEPVIGGCRLAVDEKGETPVSIVGSSGALNLGNLDPVTLSFRFWFTVEALRTVRRSMGESWS